MPRPPRLTSGDIALSALALDRPARHLVDGILEAAREYLDMDVAFASEFVDSEQVIRGVAGDGALFGIIDGGHVPLGDLYCARVVDGTLPEAIPDTTADPLAATLPMTVAGRVRAYVGVPVSLPDGRVWGSMACVARRADHSIGKRDVRFMRTLARLYAEHLDRDEREAAERRQKKSMVQRVLRDGRLSTVLQPIVDLVSGDPVGFEALARIDSETPQPPNVWFAMAEQVGLGTELELAAVRSALAHVESLPEGTYLSLNVSPQSAVTEEFAALVQSGSEAVIIEVTEHAAIADYPLFNSSVARLRFRGLRYAVDDAGAGFSTFSHILSTKPDVVKLDMSLIRDVDRDLGRRALLHGLIYFIEQINATVVAEGVETAEEAEALRRLGVHCAQGYYFGRPGEAPRRPAPPLVTTPRPSRVRVLPVAN
ncbi:MAG: sensor domain-containing phosphodiesterase [Candidatus Dormibacteria bacterium]